MRSRSHQIHVPVAVLAAGMLAALGGCATHLPKTEAAAFRAIADTDRDALADLSRSQLDLRVSQSKRLLVENNGRVLVDDMCSPAQTGECIISYQSDDAVDVQLVRSAARSRELLGAIAAYGSSMAGLAEAEDLDAVRQSADKAAGSVKTLMTALSLPPIVGPIVDSIVYFAKLRLVDRRRHALLTAATAAHPAIVRAAAELNRILGPIRSDLAEHGPTEVNAAYQRIADSQDRERKLRAERNGVVRHAARIAALREQRTHDLDEIVAAAERTNAARAIKLDFDALSKAHSELINKLMNPEYSAEEAFSQINQILTLMESIRAASDKETA